MEQPQKILFKDIIEIPQFMLQNVIFGFVQIDRESFMVLNYILLLLDILQIQDTCFLRSSRINLFALRLKDFIKIFLKTYM